MTVTAYWYGQALSKALNKEVDFNTDVIRVMLCTSSYTPAQDTDDYVDDCRAYEVGASGTYAADGAQLTTPTIGYTAGTNVIKIDADDVAWTGATITARYAVIYVDTGTDSTSALLGYVDFGANVTSTAGTFTITWAAGGILTITPAAPA